MRTGLPVALTQGARLIETVDPSVCAMLRYGMTCGNSAYYMLIIPEDGLVYRLVPMCYMCKSELSVDTDWQKALEKQHVTIVLSRRKVTEWL